MMNIELLQSLHKHICNSVQDFENDPVRNGNSSILAIFNELKKYSKDIDMIRKQTYNKSNFEAFNREVHNTDRKIQSLIINLEIQISDLYEEKVSQDQLLRVEQEKELLKTNSPNVSKNSGEFEAGESIETLRSRLLSTNHNQLDQVQTTEIQNNYHESLQQELIETLPSMVSSLKGQASQFQEMLMQDASILKEATQNFEASNGKFDNVNNLLSKYHKEGKLSYWFYIRVTAIIIVAFMIILIIIRLIPARH